MLNLPKKYFHDFILIISFVRGVISWSTSLFSFVKSITIKLAVNVINMCRFRRRFKRLQAMTTKLRAEEIVEAAKRDDMVRRVMGTC